MKRYLKYALPIFLIVIVISLFFASPSGAAPKDVGFGVWPSYEDYLANPDNPPIHNLTNDLGTGVGPKSYVLCYQDVTLNDVFNVANNSDITIDLGGHTITTTKNFRIGNGSSYTPTNFTIKNGTFIQKGSQVLKPQPNSRVYFENVTIKVETSGNFAYGDGMRMLYFKDCTLDLTKASTNQLIAIYPIMNQYFASVAKLEGKEEYELEYIHNVVFDNTYINEKGFTGKILNVPAGRVDCVTQYQITMLSGTRFTALDDSLVSFNCFTDGAFMRLNLGKGLCFSQKDTSNILTDKFDPMIELNYYNDIQINGVEVICNDITSVEDDENYVQVEGQTPKLIWGLSDNAEYPYQLCNYLCSVTWVIPGVETTTITGYADGAKTTHSIAARGYYEDGGAVYKDVHAGWALVEDGTPEKYVVITEKENTLYAVFEGLGPATAVIYSSSDTSVDNIADISIDDYIGAGIFNSAPNGSYVRLYRDMPFQLSQEIVLDKSITLDLNGHKLTRVGTLPNSVSSFMLNSGATLTVINGSLYTSFIGIATLNGGTFVADGLDITFDNYPCFTVNSGAVSLSNLAVLQKTDSDKIPMLTLANGDAANISFTAANLKIAGALLSHVGAENGAMATVTLTDSALQANSVFTVYETALSKINPQSSVNISLINTDADVLSSLSVPSLADRSAPLAVELNVVGSTFTSDPTPKDCGTIVLPSGHSLVYSEGKYVTIADAPTLKYNLSVGAGVVPVFYVPASLELVEVATFSAVLTSLDLMQLGTVTVDGVEYYPVVINGISPASILNPTALTVTYKVDGVEYTMDTEYSPVDYFALLLQSDNALTVKLAAAAMRFVDCAYAYDGVDTGAAFKALTQSGVYTSALRGL